MAETVLTAPARRWRLSVTSVAVFGLGALVALASGAVLWLGLGSAAESTQRLVQERSYTVLDYLEHELAGRLDPISEQARRISSLVAGGNIDLEDQNPRGRLHVRRAGRDPPRWQESASSAPTVPGRCGTGVGRRQSKTGRGTRTSIDG